MPDSGIKIESNINLRAYFTLVLSVMQSDTDNQNICLLNLEKIMNTEY